MRRRALLGSAAGLLGGLAGCAGQFGDGGDPTGDRTTSQATTDRPTTTRTESGFDASLDATVERHQHGVAVLAVDSVSVTGRFSQYVFYHVDVTDGVPPERTDFGFRYGGAVFGPGVDTGGQLWRASETDTRYTSGRGEGWLVFELPAERAADHAAFALGGEEWPAPEWLRERLSRSQPPLSVAWGLADDQPDDAARLSFTVANEGDVDTRFVAALNGILVVGAHSPVAGFSREIPAGETVSWTYTHDGGDPSVASTEAESDSHYHLEWTQGEDDLYVAHASGE